MSRGQPIYELLPPKLARVLRLDDDGASREDIAEALNTTIEAVPPLIELARAKVASLRERFGNQPAFEIDQPADVTERTRGPRDG